MAFLDVPICRQRNKTAITPEFISQRSAGLTFSYADMSHPENLLAALRPETRIVWIESPTNPMLKLADIHIISKICRERGVIKVVDTTFVSRH